MVYSQFINGIPLIHLKLIKESFKNEETSKVSVVWYWVTTIKNFFLNFCMFCSIWICNRGLFYFYRFPISITDYNFVLWKINLVIVETDVIFYTPPGPPPIDIDIYCDYIPPLIPMPPMPIPPNPIPPNPIYMPPIKSSSPKKSSSPPNPPKPPIPKLLPRFCYYGC